MVPQHSPIPDEKPPDGHDREWHKLRRGRPSVDLHGRLLMAALTTPMTSPALVFFTYLK